MADIAAADVAKLRKQTGAGMMDAKSALVEAGGDFNQATEILKVKGLADAKKKGDRPTDTGSIGHYLHVQSDRPVVGCLVELRCETDFVAKSDEFQAVARDLAMHLAAYKPDYVRREDVPEGAVEEARKLFADQAIAAGKPTDVIDKIVEGKLGAFYKEAVLYEQPFVNPEKHDGTVAELLDQLTARLGENISVGKIARITVGED